MKFALNENTIMQCGLKEFIDSCARAGFPAVELSYKKVEESLALRPKARIKELIEDSGVSVLSLNAFEDALLVPRGNESFLSAEAELIACVAESIDCPAIVIPSARWPDDFGPLPAKDEIIDRYRRCLASISEVFLKHHIEALFEPIAYAGFIVGNVAWTNEMLGTEELKSLRLVPDIHNLFINGDGPMQLSRFTNPIGLFHIDDTQDSLGTKLHVAKSRTFPGEGVADAAMWIRQAQKAGYQGYFSLELFDDDIYALEPIEAAKLCWEKLQDFNAATEGAS
jgi:sugar phosphate isomerase/epimerase